jgi:rhodanese-related sulfurtransferase
MNAVPTVSVDGVPDPLPQGLHVLDVREPIEWQYGHIEGSQHIPLGELQARVAELPEGQVLVVCKVGARSAHAVMYLARLGHDAFNLDGGLVEWAEAGRPMVSDTGQDPQVV